MFCEGGTKCPLAWIGLRNKDLLCASFFALYDDKVTVVRRKGRAWNEGLRSEIESHAASLSKSMSGIGRYLSFIVKIGQIILFTEEIDVQFVCLEASRDGRSEKV